MPTITLFGLTQIKFGEQSLFLMQFKPHPATGVGVGHQPSIGTGSKQGGFRSRQAGLGRHKRTSAFSLTSNVMLTIDQTKRGRATNKARVIPNINKFFVFVGKNLKLLKIDIYTHIRNMILYCQWQGRLH